jgi:hypothetical protein
MIRRERNHFPEGLVQNLPTASSYRSWDLFRLKFCSIFLILSVGSPLHFLATPQAHAFAAPDTWQDCSADWQADLETREPWRPKGMSGDTHAAYAVYSFQARPGLEFLFTGERTTGARFLSFQSYWSRLMAPMLNMSKNAITSLLDQDLSEPRYWFRAGQPTLTWISDQTWWRIRDLPVLRLQRLGQQSVMMRIYAPGVEVLAEDLPQVFAFQFGKPTTCPKPVSVSFTLDFPEWSQYVGKLAPKHRELNFEPRGIISGSNGAIGRYSVSLAEIPRNRVAVIWFRAPEVGRDVRYWSFCSQDFINNRTLACAADIFTPPMTQLETEEEWSWTAIGFAQPVGQDQAEDGLEACLADHGIRFLADTRDRKQKLAGFVYRNILPSDPFAEEGLYHGDYAPRGQVYDRDAFLREYCE